MPNSSIIASIKTRVVKELINDDLIIKAIDSPKITNPEELLYTHIFDFNQNPHTLNTAITFITIQVHIPDNYNLNDSNYTFTKPTLEFWIISHEMHMAVKNIPKVKINRNDYISELLDLKFNGRSDFGLGVLKLTSNIEGSFQKDYVFRKMVLETKSINTSLCEIE